MKPVKIPIEDVLDLHTFHPKELPYLLPEYFSCCIEKGLFTVKVIHGKGTGLLKKKVIDILKINPQVLSFKNAPMETGGWGATIVKLKKNRG